MCIRDSSITGASQSLDKQLAFLNTGLAHTDNAIANEKSKTLVEAWSYRALFASSIAITDTVNTANSIAKQKIAEEAVAKAKELDVKGDEKTNISNSELNIRNSIIVRGMKAYNKKDYASALKGFEEAIALNPKDTSMYLNAVSYTHLDVYKRQVIVNPNLNSLFCEQHYLWQKI